MKRKIAVLLIMLQLFNTVSENRIWADEAMKCETTAKGEADVDICEEFSAEAIAQIYEHLDLTAAAEDEFGTANLLLQSTKEDFDAFQAEARIELGDGIYALSYCDSNAAEQAYQQYQAMNEVVWVEPDTVIEIERQALPFALEQPADKKKERIKETEAAMQLIEGIQETEAVMPPFKDVNETEPESNSNIRIAVIDTGIDKQNKVIRNYVEDTNINLSTSGNAGDSQDDNGHGTQMAELILKSGAGHIRLLPYKIADSSGKATVLSAYYAIMDAIDKNVSVINLSLNTSAVIGTSKLLEQAINRADELGIYVVISAGNQSSDTRHITPANIASAIVISAADEYQDFACYSNFGVTVDYCALGTYEGQEGTSYAAARVSGRIAQILTSGSRNVIAELNKQALDLGEAGTDMFYGKGLICTESDVFLEREEDSNNPQDSKEEDGGAIYTLEEDIIDLDWRSLSAEELDSYLINSNAYYVGYLLDSLSEEEKQELRNKSQVLENEVVYTTLKLNEEGTEYHTVQEETSTLFEHARKVYQEDSPLLSTSEWYIKSGGVFYISSDDCCQVYKYETQSLANVSMIDSYLEGITPLKSAGITKLTRTQVKNVKSNISFTAPAIDGSLVAVPTDVRCHEYVFKPNNTAYETETWNSGYSHIVQGNDDGLITRNLYAKFKSYNQQKTGYHMAYNDVSIYKWNNSNDVAKNCTTTTAAQYYNYQKLSSDGKTVTIVSKKSEAEAQPQKIGDKELIEGKLTIYCNGVYSSKYSYNAKDESTWSRKCLASETKLPVEACFKAIGDHTISDQSPKFTLLLDVLKSLGAVTYARSHADQKIYEADIPNYVMNLVPNTYTITYDANGGSGTMKDTSAAYDKSVSLSANAFKKTGYTFAGWATSVPEATTTTGTVKYQDGGTVSNLTSVNEGTVRLYAVWTPITYYVSYNGNGATSGSMANSTHTYGTPSTLSTNGYKKEYVFTYNGNGGFVQNGSLKISKIDKTYAASHQGWHKEAACTNGITQAASLKSAQDAIFTVYAKWSTISAALPSAAREGYNFLGWSTNSDAAAPDSGYFADKSVTVAGTKTLYAVWKAKTCTVKYDANGGSGKMEDAVITWGKSYTMPMNGFVHPGYEFIGWSRDQDAVEAEFQPNDTYPRSGDADNEACYGVGKEITFYAIWRSNMQIVYMQDKANRVMLDDVQYTVENKTGADFIDSGDNHEGIVLSHAYTMDANEDITGEEYFTKMEVAEYTNDNGEIVTNEISSTVVGWSFNQNDTPSTIQYGFNTEEFVQKAEVIKQKGESLERGNAITYGKPNNNYDNLTGSIQLFGSNTFKNSFDNLFVKSVIKTNTELFVTEDTPFANLYSIYDRGAFIEAYDLYYTLGDAQSGYITESELMNHVSAYDEELKSVRNPKGNVTKGVNQVQNTIFDLWDYTKEDFTKFTSSGSVTETYRVIDSVGNVTKKQITVHIVDSNSYDTKPILGKARFISREYFPSTIESTSIWLTDAVYRQRLEITLNNKRTNQELSNSIFGLEKTRFIKAESGQWEIEPEQIWVFNHEKVLKVQQYVDEHGIGILLEEDALSNFVDKFGVSRTK